ncbi:Nif3-like dinuclear metal center hexameric protein [Arenibacter certesii]|uniref:GTP cyclohydrolase 1 type 2 homolog n=1 Tax=Arenibacter certesii TaxID=228955 RepID=A0A918IMV3_9FLAO|nr:Nif3-like dinuclear metal center hexameric protein [Arenibacter certesii]GGW23102.1 GTP cyclohydrolase 1 type 2 [Arenibacter certesii]
MIIKEVIGHLEELAPLGQAEDFDNVGLLVGDVNTPVTGILVTLDTLENVVDEAISKNCNLIVSFHPIIFSGLKKITGSNYVERVVLKAIRHHIAIYSMHTALDNSIQGVNAKIIDVLGLQDPRILIPKKGTLKKLTTYIPHANAEQLRHALYQAGAGHIGNYSNCSFTLKGTGSYKPNEGSNPHLGEIGETHYEQESQINITYTKEKESKILAALFTNHPYEEVAYEIQTLDNNNQFMGMGMYGNLEKPMPEEDFFEIVKKKMNVSCIRHSQFLGKNVHKIAVLGGSGSFAISAAKAVNADVFITADLKYHQFYEAENKIILADIGHYETEQFTKNLLVDYLTKKIPNFAVSLSESLTNPIKYF